MKGIVEIYRGEELIHREENLITDQASKTLADILTISPTLADIPSASSILDTSNYTIQAISFGKGPEAYGRNAHYYTDDKMTFIDGLSDYCIVTSSGPVVVSNIAVSSYLSDDALPSHPDPLDEKLEPGLVFGSPLSGFNNYYKGEGQNLNILNKSNGTVFTNAQLLSIVYAGGTSSNELASMAGCYPAASGDGGTNFYMFSAVDGSASQDTSDLIFSSTLSGNFNSASSMDQNGYVHMIMSSVPDSGYSLSSSYSGLTLSASPDFATTGEIMYEVMIASGDARAANLYGGITRMGLWNFDVDFAVEQGNNPPYARGPLNTTRAYRLFSTKTFNVDITAAFAIDEPAVGIPTTLTDADLKVIWRLKFL